MVNGVPQETLTSQGLQAVGVSQGWANGIDAGISIVGTVGVGATVNYTTLYRAVRPEELKSISTTGRFSIPTPEMAVEGKYFTTSLTNAKQYGEMTSKMFGYPPNTIIKTKISNRVLNTFTPVEVDGGIKAHVLPESVFETLSPKVLYTLPY